MNIVGNKKIAYRGPFHRLLKRDSNDLGKEEKEEKEDASSDDESDDEKEEDFHSYDHEVGFQSLLHFYSILYPPL